MIYIESFTVNPFQENTYVVWNDQKNCVVIDPGFSEDYEFSQLNQFLEREGLVPTQLWLTHAHIDHILGLQYIQSTYYLPAQLHHLEKVVLDNAEASGLRFGIAYPGHQEIEYSLKDDGVIKLGEDVFKCIFAPGHSPGSICFYHEESKTLIGGDVLFQMSIGRTDLPGGDHQTLLNSIKEKVYTLPEDTIVYPGHGPTTTIGFEKKNNPFVQG